MKIAVIGVPIKSGCDRDGVQFAPDYFRETGVIDTIGLNHDIVDYGNITSAIEDEEMFAAHSKIKYLDTVYNVNSQLANATQHAISNGRFPLVIGGDHSLALGSIAGIAREINELGVIWFDAHGDFNVEGTTPSGNSHGMPCAALMGWCSSKLNDIATIKIRPTNIFWVGARELDDGEIAMAHNNKLNIYSSDFVHRFGMDFVMDNILQKFKLLGINHIHCSFDIDGMDPKIVYATGTRVKNGLSQSECDKFIRRLRDSGKFCSLDFVEYNVLLDNKEHTTGEWCKKMLLEHFFNK